MRAARFTRLRNFILVLLSVSAPVFAQDYFGAIAYSAKSGAQGWSNNQPSREAAEKAALAAEQPGLGAGGERRAVGPQRRNRGPGDG